MVPGLVGHGPEFKVLTLRWSNCLPCPPLLVDRSKRFHLCEPQFPHLHDGSEVSHPTEVLGGSELSIGVCAGSGSPTVVEVVVRVLGLSRSKPPWWLALALGLLSRCRRTCRRPVE